MHQPTLTAPPPDPPELPEGVAVVPRWPWWYGPVGFIAAIVATLLLGVIVLIAASGVTEIVGAGDLDAESEEFTVIGTLIQDGALIATAVVMASATLRAKAWHFGLRRTRVWPAVGWTAAAYFSFIFMAVLYTAIVQPDGEQTVAEDLGADDSTLGLTVGAFMVILIAPYAEEFFFRGFFYGALRSKFPVWLAAVINGAVFGAIHITSSETLPLVPVLAVLGVILCLLYEKTGSLFPPIAVHAINNTIAYTAATSDAADSSVAVPISLGFGALALASCFLLPRYVFRAAPAHA